MIFKNIFIICTSNQFENESSFVKCDISLFLYVLKIKFRIETEKFKDSSRKSYFLLRISVKNVYIQKMKQNLIPCPTLQYKTEFFLGSSRRGSQPVPVTKNLLCIFENNFRLLHHLKWVILW